MSNVKFGKHTGGGEGPYQHNNNYYDTFNISAPQQSSADVNGQDGKPIIYTDKSMVGGGKKTKKQI